MKVAKLAAMFAILLMAKSAHASLSLYEVGVGTPALQAVLLASGSGVLNDIEVSSGATTDHCVAFDSATAAGFTTTSQDGTAAAKRLTTVFGVATAASSMSSKIGKPFSNGLVVICNIARHVAVLISQ